MAFLTRNFIGIIFLVFIVSCSVNDETSSGKTPSSMKNSSQSILSSSSLTNSSVSSIVSSTTVSSAAVETVITVFGSASNRTILTNSTSIRLAGTAGVNRGSISNITVTANNLTNTAIGTTNWYFDLSLLPNATNPVSVFANPDNNGKVQETELLIIVDTNAPVLVSFTPSNNAKVAAGFSVSGKLSDNLAGLSSVFLNLSPTNDSGTNIFTLGPDFTTNLTVSNYGFYYIWLKAADNAGNYFTSGRNLINAADIPAVNILQPAASGMIVTNIPQVTVSGTVGVRGSTLTSVKVIVRIEGAANL